MHTWCLAAAAAAAAGFILDDEEGIVAILESHAIAREEGDPQPRSTATDDRPTGLRTTAMTLNTPDANSTHPLAH